MTRFATPRGAAAFGCACLALFNTAAADLMPRQTAAPTTSAAAPKITAITGCHPHSTDLYCFVGKTEYQVRTTLTATTGLPTEFTDCHLHQTDLYCVAPDGSEVEVEGTFAGGDSAGDHDHNEGEHDHDHDEGEEDNAADGRHCHSHAGVEHCVGGNGEEEQSCEAPQRHYNVGLRVGLLFVIMATSGFGVFLPILLRQWIPTKLSLLFIILKQFGTGIIISTAFVHLYTHASLMFTNQCLGYLGYEGVTSAIVMAGLFLSFVVEYIGQRIVLAKTKAAAGLTVKEQSKALLSTEMVNILVMEAGIIFHSLLIGLTLVVADDTFFITLFIVILFHQMFEGIALGTRIADLGSASAHAVAHLTTAHVSSRDLSQESDKSVQPVEHASADSTNSSEYVHVPLLRKLGLAAIFAFVTPVGMAIGIGVLDQFNGNNRSTILAIGTLDALSAGILIWVGVVEMWAGDWMVGSHGHPAELADANLLTVACAGFGLIAGLVVMSVLGKWA